MNLPSCRELDRIDGKPMELECTISQDSLHCILAEIQNMMTEIQCELDQFHGRIIFMSMYNDIVWCIAKSLNVAEYARRFAHRNWSFLMLGSEKKRYGTHTYKPNGKWDRVAEIMMFNFS